MVREMLDAIAVVRIAAVFQPRRRAVWFSWTHNPALHTPRPTAGASLDTETMFPTDELQNNLYRDLTSRYTYVGKSFQSLPCSSSVIYLSLRPFTVDGSESG